MRITLISSSFFFFNDTATTEIYTLSLHDALPIYKKKSTYTLVPVIQGTISESVSVTGNTFREDRKSTRLNSSHQIISYALFCLKKKNATPLRRNASLFASAPRTSSLTPDTCRPTV